MKRQNYGMFKKHGRYFDSAVMIQETKVDIHSNCLDLHIK